MLDGIGEYLWQALLRFVEPLKDAIVCALKKWLCWMRDHFIDMAEEVVNMIFDALPEGAPAAINGALDLARVVNSWIAVKEGFVLLSALLTFQGLYIAVKFVRRLIPTLG